MEMILDKLQTSYSLSDRDRAYLKFSLKGLFYDISKIMIFFFFFLYMGKTAAFLWDMALLLLLRGNQGGLHLKHYTTCFLFSLSVLVSSIYFMPGLLEVSKPVMLVALMVCMLVNYYIGPVRNPKCRIEDKGLFARVQVNVFMIVFIYAVILYLFPVNYLLTTGFWIIIFHSIQLAIAKSLQYTKERSFHYEKKSTQNA